MKKLVGVYLDDKEMKDLEQIHKTTGSSMSAIIRGYVRAGLYGGVVPQVQQPSQPQTKQSENKPELCPKCNKGKDEYDQPSFIAKDDGTYGCLNCGNRGRWK